MSQPVVEQQEEQPHKIQDDTGPQSDREKENDAAALELDEKQKGDKLSMSVKVASPFKNYYEGRAFSVSAENLTGPFDILPKHHNFISLLSARQIIVRSQKGEQKIQISGGLMHVKADEVVVFLDV